MIKHSSFWRWASVQRRRAFGEEQPQGMSLEDYLRNLTEIVELARAHGARVLMLVFEVHGPPEWEPRSRAALEQAATLGVPALRYSGPTLDPVHPTKKGYAALALAILERLEAEGYLSDAAARGPVRRGGSPEVSAAAP